MRFQAMGDMVITLPWLQDLKDQLPHAEIHFLTRREVGEIPQHLTMFSKVIQIGGGRNAKLQFALCLLKMPWFWSQRYDVVIDLQNHRISRILRRLLNAPISSEFDRRSPILAGERTRNAINAAGIGNVNIADTIGITNAPDIDRLLQGRGWLNNNPLIILNPAGAFETRNWPLSHYTDFAKHWLAKDSATQFVLLGLPALASKAAALKSKLGASLIDLTGLTTPLQAYTIVRKAKLVLSEDSGLMHMAWTQRIPTIALLGSTRSDWSSPMGDWTWCFNSSDLPCGNCMQAKCKFGDTHCLTRWSGEAVFERSVVLLGQV